MNEKREKIIQNYIDGYNEFDTEKMLRDFDRAIIFRNIQHDEINLTLNGIDAFKQQAEQTKSYFETRQQTITSIHHHEHQTEIEIDYFAVARVDLPNGFKKGQSLKLKGKSIFKFHQDKIIELIDLS